MNSLDSFHFADLHRANHAIPLLRRFHRVHHSDLEHPVVIPWLETSNHILSRLADSLPPAAMKMAQ